MEIIIRRTWDYLKWVPTYNVICREEETEGKVREIFAEKFKVQFVINYWQLLIEPSN